MGKAWASAAGGTLGAFRSWSLWDTAMGVGEGEGKVRDHYDYVCKLRQ